ncbi:MULTISPECIES: hypothetical protein [Burkholderia]|uniref:hypothetical protein n=1 Tax=Burkholderia TaxID=32008 RepID=UPI0022B537B9|nr:MULTISPECIES: hypothetical protein [Burkholderia]MEB2541746.1 hypothetical protein [Burkholderia cenocepacia]
MLDVRMLETDEPVDVGRFFEAFEREIEDAGDEAARHHLNAGRPIYVGDDAFPGRVIRQYPDGRRELMRLNERDLLVVDRVL